MYTTFGKLILLFLCINYIRAESYKECQYAAEGTFVAVESNCLAYIYCSGDNSFTDLCPLGTYFDQRQQQCVEDIFLKCVVEAAAIAAGVGQQNETAQQMSTATVSEPEQYKTTSSKFSSITTTEATLSGNWEKLPATLSHRPHCKPAVDEYFPSSLRCEYYYRCSRGYLSILRCSFGYGWDFLLEKCVELKDTQCYRVTEAIGFEF